VTRQPQIVWLDQPECRETALVGGKAARLGELLQTGMPVPPGFCLTPGAPLDGLAAACRELEQRCGVENLAVAVRSSAVDEDSAAASFAGQYETILNVAGAEAVAQAVERCRAAAASPRVLEYRRRQGLGPGAGIAVLVQQLIPADVSAVVFSSDPVNGARDEIVINACWGLGESLVGGTVTPDTYRVRRADPAVVSSQVGEKRRMTVRIPGGAREVEAPLALRSQLVIDNIQAAEAARLALDLEARMGWPVDLECAWQAGRLWLLQCRPITGPRLRPAAEGSPIELPPDFPVTWEQPEDARQLWFSDRLHLPDPMPPLEFELLAPLYDGVNYAARIFQLPIQFLTLRVNTYMYVALEPLPGRDENADPLDAAMERMGELWNSELLPEVKQHLAAWEAFDLADAAMPELLRHLDDTMARLKRLGEIHFHIVFPAYLAMLRFADLYGDLFGSESALDAYRLLQGFDNKTLEGNRTLWRLSRKPAASPLRSLDRLAPLDQLGLEAGFVGELRDWLAEYGHRGHLFTLLAPRWIEDPTPVIQILKDYLARPDYNPEVEMAALAQQRQRLVAETRQRLKGYPQPVVDRFESYLRAAQQGIVLTEDHGFWIDFRGFYQVRRVMLEFGRRLAGAGVIDSRDDVWLLTLAELKETAEALGGSDRRQRIDQRRAELERFRPVQPPAEIGMRPPAPPPDTPLYRFMWKFFGAPPGPQTDPDLLRGNAGSAGKVRGPARVIRSLLDAGRLKPGDVLVCQTTAAPWTPLFATAAAVVTDTGGILCHSAVVAREYGIPAVVGTGSATSLLRDGQLVEVDGAAGVVRILSSAQAPGPREDFPSYLFEVGGLAAALAAAHQARLLPALLDGWATPARYSARLGLDPTATERILEVLASFGLAECREGAYAASAGLERLAALTGSLDSQTSLWSQAPAFLLRGERFAHMDGPPEVREACYAEFASLLGNLFVDAARHLAAELPRPPRHILDVGAGSGVWSLAMAERHPQARVTALDFPAVLKAFRQRAAEAGLLDRTDTIAGDFHAVEIPALRFDRILLANVLHLEPPERAAALVRGMAAALAPGGELVIVDVISDGTPERERARAVYGLHLALRTQQGRAHPLSDLRAWLTEAGLPAPDSFLKLDRSWRGLGALVGRS